MKQTIIALAIFLGCMHLALSATILTVPDFNTKEQYVHDLHYWMAGYYQVFHPPNAGITSCAQIQRCFKAHKDAYNFLNYLDSMAKWVNCLANNNFTLAKCPDERNYMMSLVTAISAGGQCWTKVIEMDQIYPAPGIFFQSTSNLTLTQIADYSSQSITNMDTAIKNHLSSSSAQLKYYQASGKFMALIMQSYLSSVKLK